MQQPLLINFGLESNSGGYALNSDATTQELAIRTLKILNNSTLNFEPLHVGVNSLLGHTGGEDWVTTRHSWEISLANKYDEGIFGNREVF